MSYLVKEIFLTLQGEGFQAGSPAVFCRFTGCNLWTGREEHRSSAVCQFCDTDFVGTDGPGGGRFATADDLADAVAAAWAGDDASGHRLVVCTGGEPLLQLDDALVAALHDRGFRIAIDDAGAGYASLRHVLRLSPDIVKLDISITRDIDKIVKHQQLAAAIISFSRDTGIELVAEGLEEGCGYGIARR